MYRDITIYTQIYKKTITDQLAEALKSILNSKGERDVYTENSNRQMSDLIDSVKHTAKQALQDYEESKSISVISANAVMERIIIEEKDRRILELEEKVNLWTGIAHNEGVRADILYDVNREQFSQIDKMRQRMECIDQFKSTTTIVTPEQALDMLPSDEGVRLKCYMSRDKSLDNTYVCGFMKGFKFMRSKAVEVITKMGNESDAVKIINFIEKELLDKENIYHGDFIERLEYKINLYKQHKQLEE